MTLPEFLLPVPVLFLERTLFWVIRGSREAKPATSALAKRL